MHSLEDSSLEGGEDSPIEALKSRLTGLEERMMFLEQHVESLDNSVREMYDRMVLIQRQAAADRGLLEKRIALLEESPSIDDQQQPPHWGRARPE